MQDSEETANPGDYHRCCNAILNSASSDGDHRSKPVRASTFHRYEAPGTNATESGNATTVSVGSLIPPETNYEARLNQLDIRFIKNFQVGRTRFQGAFDIYNLFNTAAILAENNTFGNNWRNPTAVLDARIFKVGLQMNF